MFLAFLLSRFKPFVPFRLDAFARSSRRKVYSDLIANTQY
jgi:hypothetical protein